MIANIEPVSVSDLELLFLFSRLNLHLQHPVEPETAFIVAQVAVGLQVDVIGQPNHLSGGNGAHRALSVFIGVGDFDAFAAKNGLIPFDRQADSVIRPGRGTIQADKIIQRLANRFERVHQGEKDAFIGQRVGQGAVRFGVLDAKLGGDVGERVGTEIEMLAGNVQGVN
jgi:hypothetical protein